MKHKKSGAFIALLLLFLVMGCISPIPNSIKHCFKSGNWIQNNFSILFLNSNWDFQCVEKVAIQEKNHRLCSYLHTSVDSICIQDYYEAVNDPTVCDRELGGMEHCQKFYDIKKRVQEKCVLNSVVDEKCIIDQSIIENNPEICRYFLSESDNSGSNAQNRCVAKFCAQNKEERYSEYCYGIGN